MNRSLEPAIQCLVAISNAFPRSNDMTLRKQSETRFSLAHSMHRHTFRPFNDVTYGFHHKPDARVARVLFVPRFLRK